MNQRLSVSERKELISEAHDIEIELYHVERVASILDAPKGCGIRLQYLRLPMTEEEQWAFWNEMNYDVARKLIQQGSSLEHISNKLDLILSRTNTLLPDLPQSASSILNQPQPPETGEILTPSLSVSMLCWLHRIVTEGTDSLESSRGRLRTVDVWIGPLGSTPDQATHRPPRDFVHQLHELLDWWKSEYPELRDKRKHDVVQALARFHHRFLFLHPFLDANGRVARVLLDQAARELLDLGVGVELVADSTGYFGSLAAADRGELAALTDLIEASLR